MKAEQQGEFGRLIQAFHQAQERGEVEKAEALGVQCLLLASKVAEEEPSESLRLVEEACDHENAAQWEQAEEAHRSALALAEAAGNPAMIFKAHDDLSNLYIMRNMPDQALEEAQAALGAARKVYMLPLLTMALEGLAGCYLLVGAFAAAKDVADELVRIIPTEKMYDLQRARALVMRARCRMEQGEKSSAQADLEVAWPLLAPQATVIMFAGGQSALAHWWEVTARIRTDEKDTVGAAQAMGKAVEFRRTVSQLPQLGGPYKYYALARELQRYGVTLLAAKDVEAAVRAFEESRAIQSRRGVTIQ
jgi:tetratricopeptide (TPR) repeat protein